MSESFATINDVIALYRALTPEESERAQALLPVVSDRLRMEAINRGYDLDEMITQTEPLANAVKSVTVDVVARTLQTPTNGAPMTQFSESALGYSQSGTFLTPGGGIFIKDSELKLLGIRRQRIGVIDLYGGGSRAEEGHK